jgi:hypothetical protein
MRGVCLIAYGDKANEEAQACVTTLKQFHTWRYCIASDSVGHYHTNIAQQAGYSNIQKSRWAKVTLDLWSPFEETLYLDVDTRVQGSCETGFEMLQDGWDMVITHSAQQADGNMWHIAQDEREATFAAYECGDVLQLQGGVFWFRKSEAVQHFFEAWRAAWLNWRHYDQAALLRALRVAPLKLHLLGRPFNGGSVIQHRHGQAVR